MEDVGGGRRDPRAGGILGDPVEYYAAWQRLGETLFPGHPYAEDSGGDPDRIPDLTYEDYLEFHSRYYHPSNSYIFLYGDCDMVERLTWLDKEYLSHYKAEKIDSGIERQDPFTKTVDFEKNIREDAPRFSWTHMVETIAGLTGID